MGFPDSSVGKESICNTGDLGLIPGLGRSPGEGKGYSLQYSGLENSTDRIVHGVAKSWTQLSEFHFTLMHHTRRYSLSVSPTHLILTLITRLKGSFSTVKLSFLALLSIGNLWRKSFGLCKCPIPHKTSLSSFNNHWWLSETLTAINGYKMIFLFHANKLISWQ